MTTKKEIIDKLYKNLVDNPSRLVKDDLRIAYREGIKAGRKQEQERIIKLIKNENQNYR